MADDSAARSSLDDLKHLHVVDEVAPKPSAPAPDDGGDLLASLLSETRDETKRELDQIKAELEQRKQAGLDAQREVDQARRAKLDVMREEEAERRESMIRQRREKEEAAERARNPQPAVAAAAPAEPESKKTGWLVAAAAIVIAGVTGGGWYMSSQKAEPVATPVAKVEPVKPAVAPVAVAPVAVAPVAVAPAAVAVVEVKPEPVAKPLPVHLAAVEPVDQAAYRGGEGEASRFIRRVPAMEIEKKRRTYRGNRGAKGTKRGGNRIRTSLDLGTMK
ncbi:MAG: hypothetical protein ACI9OJ_005079 [Myxococcota bacterium]|jgi:hypothetical protein